MKMDRRRKLIVIAAALASLSASSTLLLQHAGPFLGLSGDFWRGFPPGLAIGLAAVAAIIALGRRSTCDR